MVRETFIRTLNDVITENPRFSVADFTIVQRKSNSNSIRTTVQIQYNYEKKYLMLINIPVKRRLFKKNNYSEEEVLEYHIECEISPGEIELIEKSHVIGVSGVVGQVSRWLELIWEELMSIPVNKDLNNLKASVDELFNKMDNVSNDYFSKEEQNGICKKLEDLEKQFSESLKSQQLEKRELETKLNILYNEIDALKKTLKVFNKKSWLKSFGSKILNWGSQAENQKMVSNGVKIVKGLISEEITQ